MSHLRMVASKGLVLVLVVPSDNQQSRHYLLVAPELLIALFYQMIGSKQPGCRTKHSREKKLLILTGILPRAPAPDEQLLFR